MSARAWLLGGMLCLVSGRAWAQTRPQERQRSELLQRATQARAQRNWPEVVRLLREALDLRVTASVRLGLAGALLELGRHREAAHEAALCLQIAPVEPDLRERFRTEIVDACGLTLRQASAHLATVTIDTTTSHIPGVTLVVDGSPIEGFAPGRPVYLDPGRRQFRLEAPGYVAVDQTETLRQGTAHSLRLPLTPRAEDHGPGAGAATPQATAARHPLAGWTARRRVRRGACCPGCWRVSASSASRWAVASSPSRPAPATSATPSATQAAATPARRIGTADTARPTSSATSPPWSARASSWVDWAGGFGGGRDGAIGRSCLPTCIRGSHS